MKINTLGARIKNEREKRGWNQGELAKKVGCHVPNLSRWERDEVSPSVDTVIKFAKIFNISIDYLLTGSRALNTSLEALGNRLKEVREDLLPVSLSPSEMAEELGIPVSEYLDYEDGVKEIEDELLNKYENLFRINKDWLKHGKTEKEEFRPKYLVVADFIEGSIIKLLCIYKEREDLFIKKQNIIQESLETIIIMVDEGVNTGKATIIFNIDSTHYRIYDIDKSVLEKEGLKLIKNIIYAIVDEGIKISFYRITHLEYLSIAYGQESVRKTLLKYDELNPFADNGLAPKEIRENKTQEYKKFVLSKDKKSPEYKEAMNFKNSLIMLIKDGHVDMSLSEYYQKVSESVKKTLQKQTKESNPRLTSVTEKIKTIYKEGSEDQKITIETITESLIERIKKREKRV